MDCRTPGFPVHHQLLELAPTHVHWVSNAFQLTPSSSVIPFSCLQSFPASVSLPNSQFFTLGGQSIGISASTSVLPMDIQDWFPLGLTVLISLQSKNSQESSPTPQFKSINSFVLSPCSATRVATATRNLLTAMRNLPTATRESPRAAAKAAKDKQLMRFKKMYC